MAKKQTEQPLEGEATIKNPETGEEAIIPVADLEWFIKEKGWKEVK